MKIELDMEEMSGRLPIDPLDGNQYLVQFEDGVWGVLMGQTVMTALATAPGGKIVLISVDPLPEILE